jgi:flavodoxin
VNYEVAYLSQSGNTAVLAKAIGEMLPEGSVHITDLACDEPVQGADAYLIGYGVGRGTVPMKILDTLELAEGKTLLLFVTSGLQPTEEYHASVERKVLPFLPDDCDYRGLFLCAGQFPDEIIQKAQAALRQDPNNAQARALLEHHQRTKGHPDGDDLERLRGFLTTLTG